MFAYVTSGHPLISKLANGSNLPQDDCIIKKKDWIFSKNKNVFLLSRASFSIIEDFNIHWH